MKRNPGMDDIEDMTTLLPDLRDKIVKAANVKKNNNLHEHNRIKTHRLVTVFSAKERSKI